jgi:hypothetical protein
MAVEMRLRAFPGRRWACGAGGHSIDVRARKAPGGQRRQASAEPGSARREPAPAGDVR